MYSRKFSEKVELPAGYGGVALREQSLGHQRSETKETESYPPPSSSPSNAQEVYGKTEDHGRMGGRQERVLCRPRRPLYRDEKRRPEKPLETPPKEEACAKTQEPKGLLSSLFSLSGKSFTMEDIILAGLILLLLSEKEKGGKIDNELLLVLGFLLLSGR